MVVTASQRVTLRLVHSRASLCSGLSSLSSPSCSLALHSTYFCPQGAILGLKMIPEGEERTQSFYLCFFWSLSQKHPPADFPLSLIGQNYITCPFLSQSLAREVELPWSAWISGSQSVNLRLTSLASPGSLLEIQILATHPSLPPSNLLTEKPWDEAHNLCLNKPFRWLWWTPSLRTSGLDQGSFPLKNQIVNSLTLQPYSLYSNYSILLL